MENIVQTMKLTVKAKVFIARTVYCFLLSYWKVSLVIFLEP
jgi:hypothetical protein